MWLSLCLAFVVLLGVWLWARVRGRRRLEGPGKNGLAALSSRWQKRPLEQIEALWSDARSLLDAPLSGSLPAESKLPSKQWVLRNAWLEHEHEGTPFRVFPFARHSGALSRSTPQEYTYVVLQTSRARQYEKQLQQYGLLFRPVPLKRAQGRELPLILGETQVPVQRYLLAWEEDFELESRTTESFSLPGPLGQSYLLFTNEGVYFEHLGLPKDAQQLLALIYACPALLAMLTEERDALRKLLFFRLMSRLKDPLHHERIEELSSFCRNHLSSHPEEVRKACLLAFKETRHDHAQRTIRLRLHCLWLLLSHFPQHPQVKDILQQCVHESNLKLQLFGLLVAADPEDARLKQLLFTPSLCENLHLKALQVIIQRLPAPLQRRFAPLVRRLHEMQEWEPRDFVALLEIFEVLGDSSDEPLLLKHLEEPNTPILTSTSDKSPQSIHEAAANTLGAVGSPLAVEALQGKTKGIRDRRVKQAASRAIARIQRRFSHPNAGQLSLSDTLDGPGQLSLSSNPGELSLHNEHESPH